MKRVLALTLLLASCTEIVTEPPVTKPPTMPPPAGNLSSCGGTPFAGMLGRPLADLQIAGLPAAARIIRPGQAVTMDYSAQRLNVMLDGGDRVERLTCG